MPTSASTLMAAMHDQGSSESAIFITASSASGPISVRARAAQSQHMRSQRDSRDGHRLMGRATSFS